MKKCIAAVVFGFLASAFLYSPTVSAETEVALASSRCAKDCLERQVSYQNGCGGDVMCVKGCYDDSVACMSKCMRP